MKKFIVISYDSNEQQTFWDRLMATSKEAAGIEVSRVRDYAVVVDVVEPDGLLTIAFNARDARPATILAEWAETASGPNQSAIEGAECPSCGRDNSEHDNLCTSDDCPGVIAITQL